MSFLKSYQVRDGTGQGSQPGTQFFQPWVGSQGSQSEVGVAMGFYQDVWSQQRSGFHYMLLLCSDAQSYLTLCDPMDCSLPGSSVHGILQARILEWVAIPFSRGYSGNQGTKLHLSLSPKSPPSAGGFFTTSAAWEALSLHEWLANLGLGFGFVAPRLQVRQNLVGKVELVGKVSA